MVHNVNKAVVEAKVKAASSTAAVTVLILQLLDLVPVVRDLDDSALGVVIEALVVAGLSALATFWAGFRARHTPRPDLEPSAGPQGFSAPI